MNPIFLMVLVMLVAFPIILSTDESYEDGVVGKAGLGLVAVSSFIMLALLWNNSLKMEPSTIALVLANQIGWLVFLSRHMFRFWMFQTNGTACILDWLNRRKETYEIDTPTRAQSG